jgi:hypothetical protein
VRDSPSARWGCLDYGGAMTFATSAHPVDLEARTLRERFRHLVINGSDRDIARCARELAAFSAAHPEYPLLALVPYGASEPEPAKQIQSQYAGHCKACRSYVAPGDTVYWTPGEKGVSCERCGGTK